MQFVALGIGRGPIDHGLHPFHRHHFAGLPGQRQGEVAKAASITKGGVQSCFGTKDGLIEAMVTRWKNQYETLVRSNLGTDTSALGQLTTQVKLISVPNAELSKRAAAIMAGAPQA